jgi:hypothetical protein
MLRNSPEHQLINITQTEGLRFTMAGFSLQIVLISNLTPEMAKEVHIKSSCGCCSRTSCSRCKPLSYTILLEDLLGIKK